MKKLGIIAVAVLLLAGCSAEAPADQLTGEEAFLAGIHAQNADAGTLPDENWVGLGEAACGALDAGASPSSIADQLQGGQLTAGEVGSVIVLAAEYLCPAHGVGN